MKRKAFKTALPYTVPIFAGSAEFVAVNLLLGAFNPIQAFLPFILFPADKPAPKYIKYFGNVLSAAVFGLLVVYCLKSVKMSD